MNLECSNIKAFVFDVDGVFTDGGIFCDQKGELFRTFDAKDGFAVRMAAMYGYKIGIITGGRSGSIKARFLSCGVKEEDVYLGSRVKIEDLDDFCRRHGLKASEVLYVGDDLPDIQAMLECGIGACPADAVDEIRKVADYISPKPGGKGCIREIIESVMTLHGKWNFDADKYKGLY